MLRFALVAATCTAFANAHMVAWHNGMYCKNGNVSGVDDQNNDAPSKPLYNLPRSDWWFHHVNKCDEFPPEPGEYLEIPAGGSFPVEIASNRGETTLSFGGQYTSDWSDGKQHPDDFHNGTNCINNPNLHTQNQQMAAGSAFAISYQSELSQVTPENLVVFTVRQHTPWKRNTVYDVPANMPACPPLGCICAWGWIPNGCGTANMYHAGYKCIVTGATSTTPVGTGKPPVWCEDDPSTCVEGPKQMLYWHQQDGNNIFVDGFDQQGSNKSPAYNQKCGFADGAQNDIFVDTRANSPRFSPVRKGLVSMFEYRLPFF